MNGSYFILSLDVHKRFLTLPHKQIRHIAHICTLVPHICHFCRVGRRTPVPLICHFCGEGVCEREAGGGERMWMGERKGEGDAGRERRERERDREGGRRV